MIIKYVPNIQFIGGEYLFRPAKIYGYVKEDKEKVQYAIIPINYIIKLYDKIKKRLNK